MRTYRQIQEDVSRNEKRWVKTCWIADVKEINGLNPRKAPNRFSGNMRSNTCPDWARPLIELSMRRLRMI